MPHSARSGRDHPLFSVAMDLDPTQMDRDDACLTLSEIYPGVHGAIHMMGDVLFINEIWAKVEGSGQVGKYLDSLEGVVIVDSVLSKRLLGMLQRRGYKPYMHSGMAKGLEERDA